MTEFRITTKRIPFPLVIDGIDEKGDSVIKFEKKYFITVTNSEKRKELFALIAQAQKEIDESDKLEPQAKLDVLEKSGERVVSSMLGDWQQIWDALDHDAGYLFELVGALGKALKEGNADRLKAYGL
jgi:hypothetical protein